MDKKKYSFAEKIEIATVIMVLFVILFFAVTNISNIFNNTKTAFANSENTTMGKVIKQIEKGYKNDFTFKTEFVDIFNELQYLAGKQIMGGMSYVMDEKGIMHKFETENIEVDHFCSDMDKLKSQLDELEVPLVYVQAANREALIENELINRMVYDDFVADELIEGVKKCGISVLDMREVFSEFDEVAKQNVFFKSDLHMTTDAEIFQGYVLSDYLESYYGIYFPNKEYLSDMSNYDKETYQFVGSLSRDIGTKNEVIDKFDLYYPRFDTDISINDNTGGPFFRGRFSEILMHAYEKNNPDRYTYWITNYLWFGAPYYTITNNICDGPKMLFITDSLGYRSLAYLALTSGEITILDPRFYDGNDYTTKALQGEYDVVIVLQQSRLCGYEMFPEN